MKKTFALIFALLAVAALVIAASAEGTGEEELVRIAEEALNARLSGIDSRSIDANAHTIPGHDSNSLEKLNSGLRIDRSADEADGLKISERMRGQIRGLDQASTNAQDGISMVQTAEGALNETTAILQRMKELAIQAANDTGVEGDRRDIGEEIAQIEAEIERISEEEGIKKEFTPDFPININRTL